MRPLSRLAGLGRPHLPVLAVAGGAMIVVAAGTAAYAWLMGPVLTFLLTGGARFEPGGGLVLSRDEALVTLPVLIMVVGALKGVGYVVQFYGAGLFGQRVVMDLRRALFRKVTTLSPTQRQTVLSGDLLARFTTDVASVETAATYTLPSWIRDGAAIVALGAVAIAASPVLAGVAALTVPVAVIPALRLTGALAARTREGQVALGVMAGQVRESIAALPTVQAFNGEAAERVRFAHRSAEVERSLERAAWARSAVPGVMEILASVAIATSLVAGVAWDVSPGRLVSFLSAVVLLYQPIKDLGRVSQFLATGLIALERIDAILALPGAVVEEGTAVLPPLQRSVELRDLVFTYPGALRPALDGLSLSISKGQTVAVVGESGSGKSTLAALLVRLLEPDSGQLTQDGVDLTSCTVESVRSRFALVTQEPLLFSASVRENLVVGKPDATAEELEEACRAAQAHDFIVALPRGYDTRVGEKGVTLSVGQRQRLCLARALLRRDAVLVLDEATSSLDPRAEAEIAQALERILPGRTALIIAHRLSTIRRADHIHVLSAGRVVESGTHDELVLRSGSYARLWAAAGG